ncbi:MAG: hypothetical protein GY854_34320 [Deltaproteobacteria bacterium]|nr:hypothetical protein [Deltaproteobacteria bacterium]
MAEERQLFIESWPEDPARLKHGFEEGPPCPVAIEFGDSPAHVHLDSSSEDPMHLDMNMNLAAEEPVPVCVSLCEPICADSKYNIGLRVFDQDVAQVDIQGRTKFGPCDETPVPENGSGE